MIITRELPMDKMLRQLLIITITITVFNFQNLLASTIVEHICPFNDLDQDFTYEVEVSSNLIKKDLCMLDELDLDIIKRLLNQEVISKLIKSDIKQNVQFVMMAFIPAEPNLIADILFNTESLDQLLKSTNNLRELDIHNMDALRNAYPEFASIYSDIDFIHSKIYKAKSTYGTGLLRIEDQIVKHALLLKYDDSINLYVNLIESDKIFQSSYGMFKLIPYADGTILISYSDDNIKHKQALLFMDKIKSSAHQSFIQFVLDLKKMLGVKKALR